MIAPDLPDIPVLRDRCRAFAALDAVMSPDREDRYHWFDPNWAPGEELASMDNGSGDSWSIVFSAAGAFVRGFDHESPMSPAANDEELWPGLVDTVPEVFAKYLDEPAFGYDGRFEATVCAWRRTDDDRWHSGEIDSPHDGGARELFALVVAGTPEAYRDWAEDYYERPVDLDAVRAVMAGAPLTDDLVRRLS